MEGSDPVEQPKGEKHIWWAWEFDCFELKAQQTLALNYSAIMTDCFIAQARIKRRHLLGVMITHYFVFTAQARISMRRRRRRRRRR